MKQMVLMFILVLASRLGFSEGVELTAKQISYNNNIATIQIGMNNDVPIDSLCLSVVSWEGLSLIYSGTTERAYTMNLYVDEANGQDILTFTNGTIAPGTGSIAVVEYQMFQKGCSGFLVPMTIASFENQVIESIGCGWVICPKLCSDLNEDEIVDIFDLLLLVELILNDGYLLDADLATGTPPNCLEPDGVVNILDIASLIRSILGRKNCCWRN